MKTVVMLFVSLLSLSAMAKEKYVCVSYDRQSNKLGQDTVVLTQKGNGSIKENEPAPFTLERYTGAQVVASMEVEGSVMTEDVNFDFNSADKTVNFSIYLDEMNESSLTVNGRNLGSYICR